MDTRQHMTYFLTNKSITSVQDGRIYLRTVRDVMINGYTKTQSRSLWFSLLLYKFRADHDISDDLWQAARSFIMETLRSSDRVNEVTQQYLTLFDQWKKEDFKSFVEEIAGYYMNVIHLKETIESTREESTIHEWQENYQQLIHKIRATAERMGFLSVLDEKVRQVEHTRRSLVQDVMHRAFWDMLEEDIRSHKYAIVICQLHELKDLLRHIVPRSFHNDLNDKFDVEYIRQLIETQSFNQPYLMDLCHWVMDTMKEWDSETAKPLYEVELSRWQQLVDQMEWPQMVRSSIELCTVLALDAKTRIALWRRLLDHQHPESGKSPP